MMTIQRTMMALVTMQAFALGCSTEEQQTQDPWRIEETSTSDMRSAQPDTSSDVGGQEVDPMPNDMAVSVDMTMDDDLLESTLGPFRPAACAPDGATPGSILDHLLAIENLKPSSELIVLVSSHWLPGDPASQGDWEIEIALREALASGYQVLRRPYRKFKPGQDRTFGPCDTNSPCPWMLVKLSAGELQEWFGRSCSIRFVETTGFNCRAYPESCELAETCEFIDAHTYFFAGIRYDRCLLKNVAGCQPKEQVDCEQATRCLESEQGNGWFFRDHCTPEHPPFNKQIGCRDYDFDRCTSP